MDSNGKHAPEAVQHRDWICSADALIKGNDDLGIAMGTEAVTGTGQFLSEFLEVVNLPVENNYGRSIH
jgi:hypothetical protein